MHQQRNTRPEHPLQSSSKAARADAEQTYISPKLAKLEKQLEDQISKQSPLTTQLRAELDLIQLLKLQGNFRHKIMQMVPVRDDASFDVSQLERNYYRYLAPTIQRSAGEVRSSSYFEKYWRNGQDLKKLSKHREFVTDFLQEQAIFCDFQRKRNVNPYSANPSPPC